MHKTIFVVSKQDYPLNILADYVLENAEDSIHRLDTFELIIGTASLLGGGEPPVTRIKIVAIFDHLDPEEDNDLDIILSLLKRRAIELSIDLEFIQE